MTRHKLDLEPTKRLADEQLADIPRARRNRAPPPVVEGRLLEHDSLDPNRLDLLMRRHVTARVLAALGIDEAEFEAAWIEAVTRLHGQNVTVDQLHGTFLEILGSRHALVREVRAMLVGLNLYEAIVAAVEGEIVRAGTAALPAEAQFVERVRLPGVSTRGLVTDADFTGAVSALDRTKIRFLRDLEIDGKEFVDRAVVLELPNGELLLLLSEEYKTPGSGGVSVQMARRNNRMFNAEVSTASTVTFVEDPLQGHGEQVAGEITLGNLLVNTRTETTDALAVKAATEARFKQWTPRYGRQIKESKAKYGEHVDLRTPQNLAVFFIGLPYPAADIRTFMTAVHGELAGKPN